jgi:hypothetical protein
VNRAEQVKNVVHALVQVGPILGAAISQTPSGRSDDTSAKRPGSSNAAKPPAPERQIHSQ